MTWMQRASTMMLEIAESPPYRDYMRRASSAYVPLTRPEDVIGEQAAVAGDLLAQSLGESEALAFAAEQGHKAERQTLASIGERVYRAMPYLWLSDVRRSALAQSVPRHTFVPEVVESSMWWTYDVDLAVRPDVDGIGTLVVRHSEAVEVIDLARRNRRTVIYAVSHLRRGFVYPDDCGSEAGERHVGGFLALLSFLNSPYIPKKRAPIESRLRRSFGRAKEHQDNDKLVHFIDLRAAESESTDEATAGAEYRHRWIVRGHHRAQWYPSLQGHKLIWIAPYVKGPEGAPMLIPAYRVAR